MQDPSVRLNPRDSRGLIPATEPFRTLRRFGEVRTGAERGLPGSLAYVPVSVQPGCDLDAEAGSPAGVALGDGDLRVRKSSVTGKIQFERLETRSGLQQRPEPRPQSMFRKPRRRAGFRYMIRPRSRPANAKLILSDTVSGSS